MKKTEIIHNRIRDQFEELIAQLTKAADLIDKKDIPEERHVARRLRSGSDRIRVILNNEFHRMGGGELLFASRLADMHLPEREYDGRPLDDDDHIMTAEDFQQCREDGTFCNDDGSGYWVKDGKRSNDEVFGTPRLDATHVVWFNK